MPVPNATVIANYEAIIAGIQKNCPTASFILRGELYSAPEAIAFVQTLLDAALAEARAKTTWKDAMAAAAKLEQLEGPAARELRQVLALSYSNLHTELADFGIAPKKVRPPLTTEARIIATLKLRATRKARGTTSRKQKQLIFGDVTGVTITPLTATAALPGAATASPETEAEASASAAAPGKPGSPSP